MFDRHYANLYSQMPSASLGNYDEVVHGNMFPVKYYAFVYLTCCSDAFVKIAHAPSHDKDCILFDVMSWAGPGPTETSAPNNHRDTHLSLLTPLSLSLTLSLFLSLSLYLSLHMFIHV